jgi:glutathione peroxidase
MTFVRRMLVRLRSLSPLALALAALAWPSSAALAQTGASRVSAHAFAFKALDGSDIRLIAQAGKPILVVNTASLCGYTPQYAGLEALWSRYRARGLLVIGVPSNDFGGQEPGGVAEITHTAQQYGVSFPLAQKAAVQGAAAHPFYRWAAMERPGDSPRWNFHKYLIDGDGRIVASFPAAVAPTDPRLIAAIERELAKE